MDQIPELTHQEPIRIAPGEALIKAGDTDRTAYYIVEGAFKIILAVEGAREEIYLRYPGEWIGEIALILKSPRTATVIAIEPSAVVSLSQELLASLSELSQLKIYRKLSELAAERIADLNRVLIEANRQISSDLQAAGKFLESLLPPPITEGQVKTDWRFVPCMHLGGDAFGYGWLNANLFSVYILDVCGHGTKAALIASSILNFLRSGGIRDIDLSSPGQVLTNLNHAFPMEKNDNTYFSIWYGVYDKGKRQLHYANAGHLPALLYERCVTIRGTFLKLGAPEIAIGLLPDITYKTHTVDVPPCGSLLLYSDGVSEIRRKLGGIQTFGQFIKRTERYVGSQRFCLDWILKHARKVKGSGFMDDDITLLQVEFV